MLAAGGARLAPRVMRWRGPHRTVRLRDAWDRRQRAKCTNSTPFSNTMRTTTASSTMHARRSSDTPEDAKDSFPCIPHAASPKYTCPSLSVSSPRSCCCTASTAQFKESHDSSVAHSSVHSIIHPPAGAITTRTSPPRRRRRRDTRMRWYSACVYSLAALPATTPLSASTVHAYVAPRRRNPKRRRVPV